ncbi:MAG: peptidylprolyl isomerase [Pyrinomonadaceae bacterium]
MKLKLTLIFAILILLTGCATKESGPTSGIKKGVNPVPDKEIAVIEMENPEAYGSISIELYSNIAPKFVARFKELAASGFYNGTTFHRIDKKLGIIQGGDPNSKDNDPTNDGTGSSDLPDVAAEFSDLPFDTGIVGAARRGNDINSQNCQFFIMTSRQPGFDEQYTIFGKVIDGMENVRVISGANLSGERPIGDIKIKTIKIQKR